MEKLRERERFMKRFMVDVERYYSDPIYHNEADLYFRYYSAGCADVQTDIMNIPKHETVEQWEKRTGQTYPDDGPVWRTETLIDTKGEYTIHHLTTWKNYKPYGSPEIIEKWLKIHQPIVANHHGKPDSEGER